MGDTKTVRSVVNKGRPQQLVSQLHLLPWVEINGTLGTRHNYSNSLCCHLLLPQTVNITQDLSPYAWVILDFFLYNSEWILEH